MAKKRVVVGEAFDSLEAEVATTSESRSAEVIHAEVDANESKTRSNLAYGAAMGGILALMVSGGMGAYDGSFNELQSVWNVFGPIIGAVVGHYFGGSGRKEDGKKRS